MDLSTKVFGDFCVSCLFAVVGIVTVVSLAVIIWMTVFV